MMRTEKSKRQKMINHGKKLSCLHKEINGLKSQMNSMSMQIVKLEQDNKTKDDIITELKQEVNKIREIQKKNGKQTATYAQIVQENICKKTECKETNKASIQKEVKEIIRQNPKFLKDTIDTNNSIVIFGTKEHDLKNRIEKDKSEMKVIRVILRDLELEENSMEQYARLGKFEPKKNRPLKVTFKNSSVVESVMRKVKTLKENPQYQGVWINRCLCKEDRDKLREKIEEAKEKNDQRSEDEKLQFFYKVIGLQVKKWYISHRRN